MKSLSWNLSFSYAEKQMAAMTLGSVDGINKLDKKSGSNSVHGILKCDHSNESYKLNSTLLTNPKMWPFEWRLLSGTFLWCISSYCKRLLNQRMQPGKAIDFCTVTATARGDLSKNSFGRRKSTGIGLFAFLGNGFPRFSGKSSILEKRHLAIQIW